MYSFLSFLVDIYAFKIILVRLMKGCIPMLRKEIGLRIRDIRIDMGLSKQSFASLLGISGQYLGMVERGKGSLSFEKVQVLCNLTGLSADYILFGKDSNLPLKVKDSLKEYSDEQIQAGCEALKNLAIILKTSD